MNILTSTKQKLAAGAIAGLTVLGGGGVVYAAATPGAVAVAHVKDQHPTLNVLLNHSDHASFEVKTDGVWVEYDWDRGKVSAVSSTSISIARPDGTTVTLAVTPNTQILGVPNESDITVGSGAAAISTFGTALRIIAHEPWVSPLPAS